MQQLNPPAPTNIPGSGFYDSLSGKGPTEWQWAVKQLQTVVAAVMPPTSPNTALSALATANPAAASLHSAGEGSQGTALELPRDALQRLHALHALLVASSSATAAPMTWYQVLGNAVSQWCVLLLSWWGNAATSAALAELEVIAVLLGK